MGLRELYTSFGGRISRTSYWFGILVLLGIALVWLIALILYLRASNDGGRSYAVLEMIYIATMSFACTALMVQRLHDRNRSGLLAGPIWAPLIIYILGSYIGLTTQPTAVRGGTVFVPTSAGTAVLAIVGIVVLWTFIDLGCLRGTRGTNKYGHDPLP